MSRGHLAAALAAAILALVAPSAANAASFSFPLVGWWPLNDGSGQVVRDWSGSGNDGYLGSTPQADANDPSWIKGVLLGSALRFEGFQYVTIPVKNRRLEPAKITVAAWVRSDGSPGRHKYVIAKGASECNNASYGLYTGNDGGIAFYIADTPSHFIASPEAPASIWNNKWHHVAGTFDGSVVRLYVDGVRVGSGTNAPVKINYEAGDPTGQIGNYPGSCVNDLTMRGDIDGVQIWSEALPVNTIWSLLRSLFELAK